MSTVAKNTRSTTIMLAVSQAGPFLLGFRLFDADTIKVYVDGIVRTDWTLTSAFVDGFDDAAAITFTANVTAPATIVIDSSLIPWREDDLVNGDKNLTARINVEQGRVWSTLAELRRDVRRALRSFSDQEPILGLDAAAIGAAQGQATAAAASASAAAASAAAAAAAQNSLLSWAGAWVTATAYTLSKLVQESGSTYVCIQAHTSGTFATDLAAGKWAIFAQKGSTGAGSGDVLAANNGSEFAAGAGTFRANLSLMGALLTAETSADVHTRAAASPRGMWFVAGTGMTNAPSGYAANEVFFAKGFDANNLTVSWYRSDGVIFVKTRIAGTWGGWVQQATQAALTAAVSANQQLIHVRDEKASGLNAGTSTTSYTTRTLNTVKTNTISGAALASNQITLPAGTYLFEVTAPATRVGRHKAKVYNVTDGADALIGTSANANSSGDYSEASRVCGVVTIAGAKAFDVRHRAAGAVANYGWGLASSFGDVEVYAEVIIRKIS